MSWNLDERLEGLPVFTYLSATELLGPVPCVRHSWHDISSVHDFWAMLCARDFPKIVKALLLSTRHIPADSEWYNCYGRMAHACLSEGIHCPGCGVDIVEDLIPLFNVFVQAAAERGDDIEVSSTPSSCSREAIPMMPTARLLIDMYQSSPYSALPGVVFEGIVQETCRDFIEMRRSAMSKGLHLTSRGRGIEPMLRLEDFLHYWRELLVGDKFVGSAANLTRTLRPWSTAATHNLIHLLCDPNGSPQCSIEEPPEVLAMRMQHVMEP